jgi:hypothetical protein
VRWIRQLQRTQSGQTSAEYAGVLAIVAAIVAGLLFLQPGMAEATRQAARNAVCTIFGGCDPDTPPVAAQPASAEEEEDPPREEEDPPPQEEERDEGGWLSRNLGEFGSFLEGAGSQIKDEAVGLWDTGVWIYRSASGDPDQMVENGRMWEAIRDDPGAAASSIWHGIWDPIAEEWNNGREGAAFGRGAVAVLGTVFGGKGLNRLRNLRPDLDDIARRAPDADVPRRPALDCPVNSFAAATPVLLADGTTLPIAEIDVGMQVLAADPETGLVAARPVTRLINGTGDKALVDLTVAGATVTATDGHPFYLPDIDAWRGAGDLLPGDRLRTPDGDTVTVEAVIARRAPATVHNLTVADLHTYFVRAGTVDVLVHNAGAGDCTPEEIAAARRALDTRIDEAAAAPDPDLALEGTVAQAIREQVTAFRTRVGPDGSVGEVDVTTDAALIEVTTAPRGKLSQVLDYLNNREMNPDGRPVILYAPNYRTRAAQQAIRDAGAHLVQSPEDLQRLLRQLREGTAPPP